MRCAQCGSPLIPTLKKCPRCGVAIVEGQAAIPSRGLQDARSQSQNLFPVQERSSTAGGAPAGMETLQQGWGRHASPNSWNAQGGVSVQQVPVSQQSLQNPYGNAFEQYPSPQAVSVGQQKISASSQGSFPQAARSLKRNANGRSNRLGFMVSGLCVITSGLILIFVYFMSMSLPPLNGQSATDAVVTQRIPSPTFVPTLSALTPTPTFVGQQYVDNVQLASKVDPIKAQPVQVTTSFKVNQRMNVTFSVHPEGRSGTVCLLWYMNTSTKPFSNYPLPVGLSTSTVQAYAYTTVLYPGAGYVELYWGHIPSCTDPNKLLAQRVNFTAST